MKDAKEILSAALGFHQAFEAAKADGKIELADVAHFATPLLELPGAIADSKLALEQFKSASDEDRAAVLAELKAKYDIADDVLEAKVEAAVEWLLATGKFLGVLDPVAAA